MRSLVILIAGVFSFFYIDLKFFRRSESRHSLMSESSIDLNDRKKKLKRKQKKYKNRKYKKKHSYRQRNISSVTTKAKDSRYKNQKSLRRMYRND